jgi:hypothetical protein
VGAARVGDEDLQQPELPGGQLQGLAVPPGLQAGQVEAEGAGAQQGRPVHGAGAAQDGLHAGDELQHGKGLHQVVVGPQAQALQAVDLLAAGGEQQHGHVVLAFAQEAEHLEPVQLGQHQVQHDEVRPPGRVGRQGGHTVPGRLDGVAFVAQVVEKQLAEGRLVLHHEDVDHGVSLKDRDPKMHALTWKGKRPRLQFPSAGPSQYRLSAGFPPLGQSFTLSGKSGRGWWVK